MAAIPSFKLNNGHAIPGVGLGVWMGKPGPSDPQGKHVEDAISSALTDGYRHVDTACMYKNEENVR